MDALKKIILSSVKICFQDCCSFQVPENKELLALHIMFKENELRWFTDYVKANILTADN